MAIRTRRGNSADFDPDKLVSGEPATVTDNGKIKWCVSPGNVKTIATIEDMTDAITEANQPIIEQLTDGANAVANVVEGVLDGVNHVIDSNGTAYKIGMDNGELFLEELEEDTSEPASSRILQDIEDLQNNKINKTSIVQNTSVSDTDKVPSAAVTNSLQRQINEQNNNLTVQTVDLTTVLTISNPKHTLQYAQAMKYGNLITLTIRVVTNDKFSTTEPPSFTLPIGYRPPIPVRAAGMLHNNPIGNPAFGYSDLAYCVIDTDGTFIVRNYTDSTARYVLVTITYIAV